MKICRHISIWQKIFFHWLQQSYYKIVESELQILKDIFKVIIQHCALENVDIPSDHISIFFFFNLANPKSLKVKKVCQTWLSVLCSCIWFLVIWIQSMFILPTNSLRSFVRKHLDMPWKNFDAFHLPILITLLCHKDSW